MLKKSELYHIMVDCIKQLSIYIVRGVFLPNFEEDIGSLYRKVFHGMKTSVYAFDLGR